MIDPVAPRFTALLKDKVVTVFVNGVTEETKDVAKHPKVGLVIPPLNAALLALIVM